MKFSPMDYRLRRVVIADFLSSLKTPNLSRRQRKKAAKVIIYGSLETPVLEGVIAGVSQEDRDNG